MTKAEADHTIKSAMERILDQQYFTAEECDALCSTELGSSWLYSELIIQLTNMLGWVILDRLFKTHSWATIDYFFEEVSKCLDEHNNDKNFSEIITKGILRVQSVEGEGSERIWNMYRVSADEVFKHDKNVDREEITRFIDRSIRLFSPEIDELLHEDTSISNNGANLIDSLVKQFSGKTFASLVVEQNKKLNLKTTVQALKGLMDEIPLEEVVIEQWLDTMNLMPERLGLKFWSDDCGEIYRLIANKAEKLLIDQSVEFKENDIFNLCQIVICNFSYGIHVEPKMKIAVEAAIGEYREVAENNKDKYMGGCVVFIFFIIATVIIIISTLF